MSDPKMNLIGGQCAAASGPSPGSKEYWAQQTGKTKSPVSGEQPTVSEGSVSHPKDKKQDEEPFGKKGESTLLSGKRHTACWKKYYLTEWRQTKTGKQPMPFHREAIGKLSKWYETDHSPEHGAILVIPTGGGKTFVAVRFLCSYPLSHGFKVLWLAESHHLLDQAFWSFPDSVSQITEPRQYLTARIVSGAKEHFRVHKIEPSDDVVFGTLRTIAVACENKHPQLETFIESANGKLFVVFDEAHHAPAPSYRKLILEELRKRCSQMFLLGLTATPTYTDGKKEAWLKKIFPQDILYEVDAAKLMADGILAKPIPEEPKTNIPVTFDEREYRKWLMKDEDLPPEIITSLAKNKHRNEFIASHYAENKKKYKKTIMFADRWYQCEELREFLIKRGVKAEKVDVVYSHIDANPDSAEARNKRKKDENAIALDKFRKGDLDVLINVRMLTEGTDVPDIQSVFLTRQTTSKILMTQMVGRALRGPKFGGTEEAYIVSFIDDWKQLINWAKFGQLPEGELIDNEVKRREYIPLEAISIELVRRRSRQMDSGNISTGPFVSYLPKGWYKVDYQTLVGGNDATEEKQQLVMIFDHEQEGYEKFMSYILTEKDHGKLHQFEDEAVPFVAVYPRLKNWHEEFFSYCKSLRFGANQINDLFHISRHVAQNGDPPLFYAFEERENHDLDKFAQDLKDKELGPTALDKTASEEYHRADRYWSVIYYRYDQFKSQVDACINRIIRDGKGSEERTLSQGDEEQEAINMELTEPVKDYIKHRDQYTCQCCGSTYKPALQVDHVESTYYGGGHDFDNLQALCSVCNRSKGIREINFRLSKSPLTSPPGSLPIFRLPKEQKVGDAEWWKMFLQRTVNFFYQCGAVNEVLIGGKGDHFYHWVVELKEGNNPEWLEPYLRELLERVREKKEEAHLGFPTDITVRALHNYCKIRVSV